MKRAWQRTRFSLVVVLAAIATARAADFLDEVVVMRQFSVEGAKPWEYLEFPGYEVLTRCSHATTKWYAAGLANSLPLQQEAMPDRWVLASPVPITAILFNERPDKNAARLLLLDPLHEGAKDQRYWGSLPPPGTLSGLAVAFDPDAFGMCANLWNVGWRIRRSTLIADPAELWSFRLRRDKPLPHWLILGAIGPFGYRDLRPEPGGFVLPGARWISPAESAAAYFEAAKRLDMAGAGPGHSSASSDIVVMEPYVVDAKGPAKRPIILLPMAEIFRDRRPGEGLPSNLWLAQAALFVRWGLFATDDEDPNHAANFLDFVDRASVGLVTEDMFRQSFGFDYSAMQLRLANYLLRAPTEVISMPYRHLAKWPLDSPPLVFRDATDEETARILGDWERMRGDLIRAADPVLGRQYLELAGKTLRRAYGQGSRDPRFLAVCGLYERDIGEDARAITLLQAATKAGVVRPLAYLALPQLLKKNSPAAK